MNAENIKLGKSETTRNDVESQLRFTLKKINDHTCLTY